MRTAALLILSLLFLSPSYLYAQNWRVEVSDKIDLGKNTLLEKHIHSDKNTHYFLTKKLGGRGTSFGFLALNQDYTEKWKVEVKPPEKGARHLVVKLINDQIFWAYTFKDRDQKKIIVNYHTVDQEGNISESKKLVESQSVEKNPQIPDVFFLGQDEGDVFGVVIEYDRDSKENKCKWQVSLFDPELKLISDKTYHSEHTEKRISIKDYLFSTDGKVYIAGLIYRNDREKLYKEKKSKDFADFDYELIKLDKDQDTPQTATIPVEGHVPVGIYMAEDEWGNIVMAGLFKYFGDESAIKGCYNSKYDPNSLEEISSQQYDFTKRDLERIGKRSSNFRSERRFGLNRNFVVTGVLRDPEGGQFLILEENYITYVRDQQTGRRDTYYNANYVIVVHFSMSGEVLEINHIPKFHRSSSSLFIGHMALGRGNNLAIIYNDNAKNFEADRKKDAKHKQVTRSKKTVPVLAIVNQEGVNRQILIKEKEKNELLVPEWTSWISQDHLLGFMYEYTGRGKSELRIMNILFSDN